MADTMDALDCCDIDEDLNDGIIHMIDEWDAEADMEVIDPCIPDIDVEDQIRLDSLFKQGFTWKQGVQLLAMRLTIYTNREMQEHPHMQFAQWLYTHGHLTESLA